MEEVLETGKLAIQQTQESSHTFLFSMLIKGGAGCGKTALAVEIARESNFPFIKLISAESMIGFHESAKCQAIKKVCDIICVCHVTCHVTFYSVVEGL